MQRSGRLVVLTEEEENAVEAYCLWQHERGVNQNTQLTKAIIRDIHERAVSRGEKRQPINPVNGPSAKFMRGLFKRHPLLRMRNAEYVDRGRINMATKDTINQYFDLLKDSLIKFGIAEADSNGNIIPESYKEERVYLADEKGWGVKSKPKRVIGKRGASHVYLRKPSDESHKTLMLGVCGNGDVLKPLIILEKSFPLISEGEGEHLPDEVLLSKTEKGSMEQELFVEWLGKSVIPHKQQVNPDKVSVLIVDNHGSRFSTAAIDLCKENKLEMVTYPGHLTHILQGPDVVLNKPISTIVDNMVHNKPLLSGNSDLTRVAFCAIVAHAVSEVCTEAKVKKAFQATGVIPFNPDVIDLSKFPTSLADIEIAADSPIKATCSSCRSANVELHPLVKQGVIPKKLAEVFVYTPPPNKTKSKSKVVKEARIVTSEEVKREIGEIEKRKKNKKGKMPRILLKDPSESEEISSKKMTNDDETDEERACSSKIPDLDESFGTVSEEEKLCDASDDESIDFEVKLNQGDHAIVQYAGKKKILYYAAIVTEVVDHDMYKVMFYKRSSKNYFILDKKDTDEVGEECILERIDPPTQSSKTDRIYYTFDTCSKQDDLQ